MRGHFAPTPTFTNLNDGGDDEDDDRNDDDEDHVDTCGSKRVTGSPKATPCCIKWWWRHI